jgi:hypothetical protein
VKYASPSISGVSRASVRRVPSLFIQVARTERDPSRRPALSAVQRCPPARVVRQQSVAVCNVSQVSRVTEVTGCVNGVIR